jgi:hypothetical protein
MQGWVFSWHQQEYSETNQGITRGQNKDLGRRSRKSTRLQAGSGCQHMSIIVVGETEPAGVKQRLQAALSS